MSLDDRDWYIERQKKTLDKILGESGNTSTFDKIKRSIYNPKEFRSNDSADIAEQEPSSGMKAFFVISLIFAILFAAFDYSRKGIVWQILEKEGKYRHLDKRSEDERKVDAQIDTWKDNKGLEMGICKDDAYANPEDISQFSKKVDLFLKKVATEKKRHQSEDIDITDSQLALENLSREGNELIRFYNKKLVRCYANQVTADLVSKKAKSVNTSINDLSKSFQKKSSGK
jgi:hypothetical protein